MNTQSVRNLISTLELDPEVKTRIESYLAPLDANAEVPKEVLDQIDELLSLEMDTNELLAQAYEQTGQEVDNYLKDIDKAVSDADQPTSSTNDSTQ